MMAFDTEWERYMESLKDDVSGEMVTVNIKDVAKHFARWQKEQMLKDSVEGKILGYMDVIDCPVNSLATFNNGDNVKIIIVKEDEK